MPLKVASFNINGIKARLPRLLEWLEETRPSIACLQEIKTQDEGFPAAEFDLRRVVWPDDGKEHVLEIRFADGRTRSAELYFDGERVARKIRLPFGRRSRGGIRVGVSGQAPLETRYRFDVTGFEMFRRLPEGREQRRR